MSEHTGFHNKEHYSPDCPKCEQKDKLRARVIGALKRDFEALYVKEYSTRWEIERLVRGIELDIMGLSNIIALIPDIEEARRGERIGRQLRDYQKTGSVWSRELEDITRQALGE